MGAARPEIQDALVRVQRGLHPPAGVLAEHQVAAVQECERFLVLALHGGLHRGFQGVLDLVDQFHDREHVEGRGQADPDLGRAALGVRRGDDALLAAQPFAHLRVVEGLVGGKVF